MSQVDNNEQAMSADSNEQTVNDMLAAMSAQQLSTLAFNLGAISWIGLNLSFDGVVPVYQPGCFVAPNILNVLCALILIYSTYLACRAVARGSLLPCFLVFTFAFSLLMTIYRQLTF